MSWSWKLGRIAGIDVYVHATFVMLLAWIAMLHWSQSRSLSAVASGVGYILALFGCVVAHEYGHISGSHGKSGAWVYRIRLVWMRLYETFQEESDWFDKLFTRFFRGQEARSRTAPGTGLGLAIVRDIARAHGGDCTVTSEPGGGTTFTVTMPHVSGS